jgi:N utilization substance protein B
MVKEDPSKALAWAREELSETDMEFAEILLLGVVAHLEEIDDALAEASRDWDLGRMPAMDRNVLRVAAYEVLFSKGTPEAAAINEAVDLAKAYGTEDSWRFVNGVLASLVLKKGKPGPVSK